MARIKKYKIGDRIFYEHYDGSIGTSIVIDIEDKSYIKDNKEFRYQSLITWRDGGCSMAIENYNCLPYNHPSCRELVRQYAKFDKEKEKIISSIMNIIGYLDKSLQNEILDLLSLKINGTNENNRNGI